MHLRTKLLLLIALLSIALLVNLSALLLLARTFSRSLQTIQDVAIQQQATALQMQALLRDAEAALYRYQIEGEAGFAIQFANRLNEFGQEIKVFESLASGEQEQAWAAELKVAQENASELGNELIQRRNQQAADLQTMETLQTETTALLHDEIAPRQPDNPLFQETIGGMLTSLNEMPSAVTDFLATSEERERIHFTETAVSFRQHLHQFQSQPGTDVWAGELEARFLELEAAGSRLISGRDQQQALFAQFAAILFHVGQELIVGEIQPQTAQNLAQAEADITAALRTSIGVSVVTAGVTAVIATIGAVVLLRQMGRGIQGLLHGADRIAKGDLSRPIPTNGSDEMTHLAQTFNQMMSDLASREHRLQARISELETLRHVNLLLTSTLDLTHVLHTIAGSALKLVHAAEVHIFLCDETGTNLQFGASVHQEPAANVLLRSPRPNGLVIQSTKTGRPQVIDRARQHPLYNTPEAQSWNIQAAAAYPLKLADRVLGVLNISLADRDAFNEADLRILQLLADQAAVALENARLYQNIAEKETRLNHLVQQLALVQEEERRLVGLDLHDGLTQILLSANMHLNTFAALANGFDNQAQVEFSLGRTRLQEAIEEIRWVVSELRPTELEDYGLVNGLRNYAAKVALIKGWQVEFLADLGQLTLSSSIETALFRIAQEAINNARKHAQTPKIFIQLMHQPPYVMLKIQDWGCGFDLTKIGGENEHLGLIGMQERAALLKGSLVIDSRPGRGTTIVANILTDEAEKDNT